MICYKIKKQFIVLGLVLAMWQGSILANALNNLGDRIDAKTFLEDGFALVNAPEYFDALKTQLDLFGGFSFLFDLQSRWVKSQFIVRDTNKAGQPLYGDPSDGIIEGTAMRERMAFMFGLGRADQMALRFGFLFDYVFASHLSGWFKALAQGDLFDGGGQSGFSAYSFVSSPFINFRMANMIDISYMAWLKQRHPYDASGAFLSTWVPHYTGTDDNAEGNYLEPWAGSDAGRGDYDGDLFWPEDRVKYRREFDQLILVNIAGFNFNTILAEGVGMAAWRAGAMLNRYVPLSQLVAGFMTSVEQIKEKYNFNHEKNTTNLIFEPTLFLPLFRIPQLLATKINFGFSGLNSFSVEYHLGTVPASMLSEPIARQFMALPIKISFGVNWFKWRTDGKYYAGFLTRFGFDLIFAAAELTFSNNYESEMKKALARRNELMTEFSLKVKLGGK